MPTGTATKLDDALDTLAEVIGDSKENGRDAALKIIEREDGFKNLTAVFRKKYLGNRTAAEAATVTELETQLKAAKDELAEAKQQIKELEGKEPNWQRRLEDEAKKWQAKLDAAESKVSEERRSGLQEKRGTERQKFVAALRIGQEGGVEEGYGLLLPAQYDAQFVPDEESRTVKVREIGEKDAFYDPADGDPAEQLARDVLAKVPPKYRIMGDPNPGGGTQGGGSPMNKALAGVVAAKRNDPLYGGGF